MIGVLVLATNRYREFLQLLVDSIDKHIKHEKRIFVFTEEYILISSDTDIRFIKIPPYKFPWISLYRYQIFHDNKEHLSDMTHLLYLDVDMDIVSDLGEEIMTDGLLAVRHPGFWKGGWGSNNNLRESLSYLPEELRYNYYCGGVQGGETKTYLAACKILSDRIRQDELNAVTAEWHDETHWNWLLKQDMFSFVSLDPSYCMVEELHRRKLWGIDHLKPKIIALTKNHEEVRA